MLEDAYNEILSSIKRNEKINFIAINRNGTIMISDTNSLSLNTFLTISEAQEYIETL